MMRVFPFGERSCATQVVSASSDLDVAVWATFEDPADEDIAERMTGSVLIG